MSSLEKNSDQQHSEASSNCPKFFYAVRKCPSLQAPAIFLKWDDCRFFVTNDESEFRTFELISEAVNYIGCGCCESPKKANTEASSAAAVSKLSKPAACETQTEAAATTTTTTTAAADGSTTPKKEPSKKRPVAKASLDASSPVARKRKAETPTDGDDDSDAFSLEGAAGDPDIPAKTEDASQDDGSEKQRAASKEGKATSDVPSEKEGDENSTKKAGRDKKTYDAFEQNMDRLIQYKLKYGTCDIPAKHETVQSGEFLHLDRFVIEMRRQIRLHERDPAKSRLNMNQVLQLLNVGFVMSPSRGRKETDEQKQSNRMKKNQERFEEMFQVLAEYKEAHGTCDVPSKLLKSDCDNDRKLCYWVSETRRQIKLFQNDASSSTLQPNQVQRLLDLGFVLKPERAREEKRLEKLEATWDEMLQQLREFQQEHGHCIVPFNKKNKSPLRLWILQIREEYKRMKEGKEKTMLTAEKIAQLTETGFDFSVAQKRKTFDDWAYEWLEFKTKHGGREPKRDTEEEPLAVWATKQRKKYEERQAGNKTNITQEQIDRLTAWGFRWEATIKKTRKKKTVRKSWDERFADLLQYKEEHGDTMVPARYPDLGPWVKTVRKEYKKFAQGRPRHRITKAQIARLKEVEFVFEPLKLMESKRELASSKAEAAAAARTVAARAAGAEAASSGDDDEKEETEDQQLLPPQPGHLYFHQQPQQQQGQYQGQQHVTNHISPEAANALFLIRDAAHMPQLHQM